MKFPARNAAAKNLVCFACVLVSLAPAVVGPPGRNFTQGQPELQQSMDNMVSHELIMKRYPSIHEDSLPILLTGRLLEVAEHMLAEVKDTKERLWMQSFVHKLRGIDSALHRSVSTPRIETKHESAQSLNGLTVSLQSPAEVLQTAVPPSGPKLQQMTSKSLEPLPELNQIEASELATTSEVTPVDDLVKELESLHKNSFDTSSQTTEAFQTSSIPTTSPPSHETDIKEKMEIEKEKIKVQVAEEIAELKRLGETEEDIMKMLHIGGKPSDSNKVEKESPKEGIHTTRELDKDTDHQSVKRILTEEEERNYSKISPNYWDLPTFHTAEAPRLIYMNNTFLGMHINIPPVNPPLLRRPFGLQENQMERGHPFYYNGVKNAMQYFRSRHNAMLRNHMYPYAFQQDRPSMLSSAGANSYTISESANRNPTDNPALRHYPKLNPKSIYMPYPLHQSSALKSSLVDETKPVTMPSSSKSPTEFSDEMKRQLRDGKVILLSDNVVRSNFTESVKEKKPKTGGTDK